MSVEAMVWVLRHSEAKLGARLVLLALADYAHPDGSNTFPSVDTIARHANISRRAAQSALRTLEAEGMITRDGFSRSGTACWQIVMGGEKSAPPPEGGEDGDTRGRSSRHKGGEAASPNPSKEQPSKEPSTTERARAKAQSLPPDFPEALKPHARKVFTILRGVAEQHNAREVTPRGVGLAIQGHEGRRFVSVAYELASWAAAPPRPVVDVVATYRTFLDRAPVFAGVEPLDAVPTPIAAKAGGLAGGNVHPINGARPSRFDVAQAGLAELHARLVAEGK